jgi:hypothetical protein
MINKIILKLRMSVGVTDFRMHCEKIGRHLMIKIGKRILIIIRITIHGWILASTLDNHVVQHHAPFITSHMSS